MKKQYILSEEEYNDLKELADRSYIQLSKTKLKDLCTKIADNMPITTKERWRTVEPSPWGCYLTEKKFNGEWYCDDCPVQEICPHPHHYSK